MSERPAVSPAVAPLEDPSLGSDSPAPPPVVGAVKFVTASHHSLFAVTPLCSVCNDPLHQGTDDDASPFAVQGRGLLLFSRGDERRAEEPLLCETCSTAVGLAALRQFHGDEGDE